MSSSALVPGASASPNKIIAPACVESRVRQLNTLLASHGGGLELVGISEGGVAQIRFTGMCCGCLQKPLTMAATISPGLIGIGGIRSVEAESARLSTEGLPPVKVS